MVRMPRVRGALTQDECNRIVEEMMRPLDWLDRLMYWSPLQKNLMRVAVRHALLGWNR